MIEWDVMDREETWCAELATPTVPRIGERISLEIAQDGVIYDASHWRVYEVLHQILAYVNPDEPERARQYKRPKIFVYVEPDGTAHAFDRYVSGQVRGCSCGAEGIGLGLPCPERA